MTRALSAVAVLFLVLGGPAGADSKDGDKKPAKDALPGGSAVRWDVRVLEESPAYEVVKREVKGNTVTWVLENKRGLGSEIVFGYQAVLLDDDGVALKQIGIEVTPFLMNMAAGERNRFCLHLPPPDKLKGVAKVVLKNGLYGG